MKGDCYVLRKLRVKEISRFRLNWALICSMGYFHGVLSFITAPSLHQFITSSSNASDSQVVPGLGLSEIWYSWAVSAQSIGIFVGALLFSVFARSFYYKYIIISSLFVAMSSGVIYGFAVQGWMVITGRLLSGIYFGISMSITRTYIGESSDKVIQMRKEASLNSDEQNSKEKSSLKYTNFFLQFATAVLGTITGPALGALASQISSLDPFRWPGYYLIIHGGLLNIFVMLFFSEKWDDVNRKKKSDSNTNRKKSKKCQKPDQPVPVILIIVSAFFIIGWVTAIIETLENPVLSGNFGLTIKYQSYIFIATLALFTVCNTLIYILQRFHIDNRFLMIGGFVFSCIGTVLVGDWQSIRGDPCNAVSSDLQCNTMEFGSGMINEALLDCSVQEKGQFCDFLDNSSLTECCNSTSTSTAGCICESLSDVPNYNCYWNPNSIITGEYCERCRPVCLSHSHTLSLIQFLIGVFTISGSVTFNRIIITLIVSDLIGKSKQGSGWLFGLIIGAGGLSQSTGPLWTYELYLLVGNRTWLVSTILAALQFILIISAIIFFKQFKPKGEPNNTMNGETLKEEDKKELLQFEEMNEEVDDDNETPL